MAQGNNITIVGNVTAPGELRFTPNGAAVCNFSVAVNEKGYDGREDEVSFFDVVCWKEQAENVAADLTKGVRVVVVGKLKQRTWEAKDGSGKRSKVELIADEVAPSLRWANVTVARNDFKGGAAKNQPAADDTKPF